MPYAAVMAVGRKLKLGQRASWTRSISRPFQRFAQSEFLDMKKVGSKVITKTKCALITAFLSGDTAGKDVHFKFWVKSRDFQLMDYRALGLIGESTVPSTQEEGIYQQLVI